MKNLQIIRLLILFNKLWYKKRVDLIPYKNIVQFKNKILKNKEGEIMLSSLTVPLYWINSSDYYDNLCYFLYRICKYKLPYWKWKNKGIKKKIFILIMKPFP